LSGSFVDLAEVETSLEKGEVDEPWSAEIVREFFSKGSGRLSAALALGKIRTRRAVEAPLVSLRVQGRALWLRPAADG
jgi:hypothetical protein